MIVFLLYFKNQHSTDRCQFLGGSTSLSSLSPSSTRAYYFFLHLILQNISSHKLFFFFATTYSPAFLPSFLLFLMLRLYRHRPSSIKTSFHRHIPFPQNNNKNKTSTTYAERRHHSDLLPTNHIVSQHSTMSYQYHTISYNYHPSDSYCHKNNNIDCTYLS